MIRRGRPWPPSPMRLPCSPLPSCYAMEAVETSLGGFGIGRCGGGETPSACWTAEPEPHPSGGLPFAGAFPLVIRPQARNVARTRTAKTPGVAFVFGVIFFSLSDSLVRNEQSSWEARCEPAVYEPRSWSGTKREKRLSFQASARCLQTD